MNIVEGKNNAMSAILASESRIERRSKKNMNARNNGEINALGVPETKPFRIHKL
jgi:hypothetical protein